MHKVITQYVIKQMYSDFTQYVMLLMWAEITQYVRVKGQDRDRIRDRDDEGGED